VSLLAAQLLDKLIHESFAGDQLVKIAAQLLE
jgi:hypothetical protein